jgi:hypothetical protein
LQRLAASDRIAPAESIKSEATHKLNSQSSRSICAHFMTNSYEDLDDWHSAAFRRRLKYALCACGPLAIPPRRHFEKAEEDMVKLMGIDPERRNVH